MGLCKEEGEGSLDGAMSHGAERVCAIAEGDGKENTEHIISILLHLFGLLDWFQREEECEYRPSLLKISSTRERGRDAQKSGRERGGEISGENGEGGWRLKTRQHLRLAAIQCLYPSLHNLVQGAKPHACDLQDGREERERDSIEEASKRLQSHLVQHVEGCTCIYRVHHVQVDAEFLELQVHLGREAL